MVLDLDSGAVVFVGDGQGAKALNPFWKRLRGSRAKIEAVAMDMSPAYQEAVSTHLPDAKIVFDRFHVMKLFNEKLSDVHRVLYREATYVLDAILDNETDVDDHPQRPPLRRDRMPRPRPVDGVSDPIPQRRSSVSAHRS